MTYIRDTKTKLYRCTQSTRTSRYVVQQFHVKCNFWLVFSGEIKYLSHILVPQNILYLFNLYSTSKFSENYSRNLSTDYCSDPLLQTTNSFSVYFNKFLSLIQLEHSVLLVPDWNSSKCFWENLYSKFLLVGTLPRKLILKL